MCHVQEFSPDFPPSTTVSGGGAKARGVQVTDGKRGGQTFMTREELVANFMSKAKGRL